MDELHADEPLLRKASFTFWLLGALMLLVALLVGFSLFGPNPPIVIGKATTRITTPLDADGLPNYAAVLLADSRKGVTPENNGAVPFLMAMWPEENKTYFSEGFTAENAELLCTELGFSEIPPIELRVTPIDSDKMRLTVLRLLRERLPKPENLPPVETEEEPDGEGSGGMGMGGGYGRMGLMPEEEFFTLSEKEAALDGRVVNFLAYCQPVNRIWTAEELPFLAEWLEENRTAIDLIVKGAERPEWHFPPSALLRGGTGSLMNSFGEVHILRNSSRLLKTRCCFYQGKGEYEEAIRNALAILRLSHHASKGPFYVDQLVAASIGGIGLRAIDRIVVDKAVPVAMLRSLLKEFDSIGPSSRVAYAIDHGERFFGLDYAVYSSSTNDFSEMDLPEIGSIISYDWNHVLREQNNQQDAYVAAAKLPTWTGRQAAIAQITSNLSVDWPPSSAGGVFSLLTASGRGKVMASALLCTGSNVEAIFNAEDRVTTERQLTRLGIALAIHRAEQGAYPEALDELVPSILPKLPVDLFHKNPFAYHKADDGFLLYSLGANGTDEKGSNHGVGWGEAKLEGVEIMEPEFEFDINDASAWDKNGEYIGGSGTEEDAEDSPFAQIPAGADDMSLRVPLPAPEPWPWEMNP